MEMLDQTNIKVIGFDLDGTLYPLTREIQKRIRGKIYEKIAGLFDISLEEAERRFEEGYERIMSGSKVIEEIALGFGRRIDRDIVQESVEEADILNLIDANPELRDMLQRFSRERGLDLLTSSEYGFALEKLRKLGIDYGVFEKILHRKDGSKSSGEMYEKWISIRGLSPSELFYVGDNKKQDIDSPKRLGIRTCIVGKYGGADFQIADILQLEEVLAEAE